MGVEIKVLSSSGAQMFAYLSILDGVGCLVDIKLRHREERSLTTNIKTAAETSSESSESSSQASRRERPQIYSLHDALRHLSSRFCQPSMAGQCSTVYDK